MALYHFFIGLDIGKFEVVVACQGSKATKTYSNTAQGFEAFCADYGTLLSQSLVVLETTGGYEKLFLYGLVKQKVCVHRANTRQVKAFIRSFGIKGKTDRLDALALAKYGHERELQLDLYCPQEDVKEELKALSQRHLDLNKLLVQEKNRAQAPAATEFVKNSCQTMIESIENELVLIREKAQELLALCPDLSEHMKILKGIPGIGELTAFLLTTLLPELGTRNRRQIASLCGLAPHPHDSGTLSGYRRTFGGRQEVRNILFMAGMAAARSKSSLGDFYRKLLEKGKKKMVAVVALMRRILVIANARIKDFLKSKEVVDVCGKCV